MRILITFGPTYEPLDNVRRLTNFSTGRLGTELANFMSERGHEVTALRGHYSTHREECRAGKVIEFTTTRDLLDHLRREARVPFDAIFHAAAVSDFGFGGVFEKDENGTLRQINSGKYSTRSGILLAELVPTPKIIAELRSLFPKAKIFGWKYEVDGTPEEALTLGKRQITENSTDYSVVNGAAYGEGFGIVAAKGLIEHCPTSGALHLALLRLCEFR